MKVKTTEKAIKNNYSNVICVGYCDLWHLLRCTEPKFYTAGVYGWNADIYEINNNTAIVTGYRPFGNIHASYSGICNKYEEKARAIVDNWDLKWPEKSKKLEKLLAKFIEEALQG